MHGVGTEIYGVFPCCHYEEARRINLKDCHASLRFARNDHKNP